MSDRPATLRRRLAAFAVDYVVLALYLTLLTALAFAFPALQQSFGGPGPGQAIAFLVVTLPITLYFAVFEATGRHATPGKRLLGLRVARVDGSTLTLARSVARSALKFVPWEIAHTGLWRVPGWPAPDGPVPVLAGALFVLVWVLIGLNIVFAVRSPLRQTLYDRLSDTVVRAG